MNLPDRLEKAAKDLRVWFCMECSDWEYDQKAADIRELLEEAAAEIRRLQCHELHEVVTKDDHIAATEKLRAEYLKRLLIRRLFIGR